jgi:transposase
MPLLPADQITLSDAERGTLEAIARAHTTAKQIALRAQIILLADEGVGIRETMRRLGTWDNIVRRWRKRWRARVHESQIVQRLPDEPRSGKPSSITPEQICRIVALACQPPILDEGPPISHWSLSALAAEAVRRGIIETISAASIGRILKRSRPQASPEPLLAHPKAG